MTTAVVNSVLIDTNILVYAAVPSSSFHTEACAALKRHYSAQDQIWISTQVIREFIAVLTSPKFAPKPLSVKEAVQAARYFHQRFTVADENRVINQILLDLVEKFSIVGQQIHDANLVATCQVFGIASILTHNMQDFELFSKLVRLEPLIAIPSH